MAAPDPSLLDLQQILQRVYDEAEGRLRTNAVATISNVSIAVDLNPSDDGVFIADKDTGYKLKVNSNGSINVNLTTTSGTDTPSIQNVLMVVPNVENTIVLPVATKKFQLRVRGNTSKVQLGYEVSSSSTNYTTISRGCNYTETDLFLTTINRVLYVQANKANTLIECVIWV